ncbi:MAG: carboxymethylenebutenolidase [Gammaproteobacteria bacterium]|nr:MAG: carboxymethylenebutenolidase [Gammaproteobacteria bacterium]
MIETRLIEYRHEQTVLEGFLAAPRGVRSGPTVLVAHMWGGRVPFVCEKARALAEQGYTAFALDVYGKGVFGRSREECAALMKPFVDDRRRLVARLQAALDTARAQAECDPERVAIMGYCFGGLCALDLARSGAPLRGAASVHGLLPPAIEPLAPGRVQAAVLLLHGEKDPTATLDDLRRIQDELSGAGVDWQSVVYGGAYHAFTNPEANDPDFGTVYDARADRRSWRALLAFLDEVLA